MTDELAARDAGTSPADRVIHGGTVVSMRGDGLGIVDEGAVAVTDGWITFVGPRTDCPPADETIDAEGCVLMPGLVNAHAHTSHTLLRGAAQDVPEIEWMTKTLGPLANAATTADRTAGARLGVCETIRGGVTTVCEYASHVGDLVERVHEPLGVRTVAVETITEVPDDRSGADPDEPYPLDREQGRAALDRADRLFERFDSPRVIPAYGPQALDMVSPETFTAVFDHADDRDAAVHAHVAQGERERRQIAARYGEGARTVPVMAEQGLLDERLVAVHCHDTEPAEREQLIEAGASLIGCPSSIAAIDGRVPPVADYRERGGTVGLGTDQAPGPGHHNPLREGRTAATLSKVAATDPTALPAPAVLRALTVGGAAALGLEDVGRLAPGYRGDVVVIDTERLSLAPTVREPIHTAIANLVYASTGREVRDVFVGGEPIVREGRLTTADREQVLREANEHAHALWERAGEDWLAAGSTLARRAADDE